MDKASRKGISPVRSGLKHRFAQILLQYSSCTTTATSTNLMKLSNSTLPRQEPECYCQCRSDRDRCRHRIAPVVQVSVHCGARHSIRAVEPLLPSIGKEEKKSKKKERRVTENGDLYETGKREGRKCPPASPSSPTRSSGYYYYSHDEDKKKKAHGIRKGNRRKETRFSSSSSFDCNDELGLFSSTGEEAEEPESLFSSKSFSSDSSEFYCNNRRRRRRRKEKKSRSKTMKSTRRPSGRGSSDSGDGSNRLWPQASVASVEKKVKAAMEMEAGLAFVKDSSDPYMDFRSSMVEMIVERQMSSPSDMEKLLHSYLSLNSPLHHPVIIEAFVDIWEAILGE